jgi:hypothetical protein
MMAKRDAQAVPDEQYRQCFVAFLDILGFRSLIARIAGDPDLLHQLSSITALAVRPGSGEKRTSLGPCLIQTRAFSDCVVVFTPSEPMTGERLHPNPLAQLLFVVRYFHDQALELGVCIRGGVSVGPMYWHETWSDPQACPPRGSPGSLPLTFGQGLIDAYKLESEVAKVPRVVVSGPVFEHARTRRLSADPFAKTEHDEPLTNFIQHDRDAVAFLDLLHRDVTRSRDEKLTTLDDGFTVEWLQHDSSHAEVMGRCERLAEEQLATDPEASVRSKYEWLRRYVASHHEQR